MDVALQKYYEARLSMMADQAWLDLMEDVQKMLSATNTVDGVSDERALQFKKGELSIMRWLLSLKQTSEEAFESLKNE